MRQLLKAIIYAIIVMILAMGVGNGINALRLDLRPERVEPPQPPPRKVVAQASVQPAVQVETLKDLPTDNRAMFRAICLWEHRGVIRPDDVSSAGAVGPAQITPIFLRDLDTDYTLEDCKDYETAFFLTQKFWRKYNLKTDEERARCHLAGPRAMKRKNVWPETTEYWAGVRSYLN